MERPAAETAPTIVHVQSGATYNHTQMNNKFASMSAPVTGIVTDGVVAATVDQRKVTNNISHNVTQ